MPGFRNFDAARFLRENWQKRPLLIRNPWQVWENPLDPDELAGLACEPEVESRLVCRTGAGGWVLEHGPLAPDRFGELGDSPWTLLVQSVDHHVPAVAGLIEPFRFLPDWRIDDVMVSYATEGAGVGPHYDHYDVFLIQGLGRRRWSIGRRCDGTARLLPHESLRLLADFEPVEEWVLEPGDILYVPPGFAHDGVAASSDCMTYSVGFRAPSRGDLVSAWADHVLDTLGEDDRFTDADLAVAENPGEILPEALARLHEMATGALLDRDRFAAWFGQYVTARKDDSLDWAPEDPLSAEDFRQRAAGTIVLERNPASRFAFIRTDEESVTLFVDAKGYPCRGRAAILAERICADARIVVEPGTAVREEIVRMIVDLANRGCLAVAGQA
ncbi:JmjC domain-containing protein [Tsuneonella sp. SYSU-LHT278]|uniref:JmjC domain-containing protein n=1 Tax=Tsuneonella sediminis TaxID=3416089 RepID=UPI003F7AF8A6